MNEEESTWSEQAAWMRKNGIVEATWSVQHLDEGPELVLVHAVMDLKHDLPKVSPDK